MNKSVDNLDHNFIREMRMFLLSNLLIILAAFLLPSKVVANQPNNAQQPTALKAAPCTQNSPDYKYTLQITNNVTDENQQSAPMYLTFKTGQSGITTNPYVPPDDGIDLRTPHNTISIAICSSNPQGVNGTFMLKPEWVSLTFLDNQNKGPILYCSDYSCDYRKLGQFFFLTVSNR